MEGSGKDSPGWLDFIRSHMTILATAGLFAFVVIKVLGIANGNAETAIAIMSSVGVAQVTLGVVVASYGLFLLVWFYWVVWWGVEATSRGQSTWPSVAIAVLVGIAVFALDSIFLGTVMVVASTGTILGMERLMPRFSDGGRRLVRSAFGLIGVCGFMVFLSSSGQWLPTEEIVVHDEEAGRTSELVGYVLNDSKAWVSVLTEADRLVLRLPAESIVDRGICTLDSDKFFGPSWVEIVGHDSEPVPLCGDL